MEKCHIKQYALYSAYCVTVTDVIVTDKVCNSIGESENEMMMMCKRGMDNAESVEMSGRAISYLAVDPKIIKKTGRIFMTADLAREYGFTDVDGVIHSDQRSVQELLYSAGFTRLAGWVPKFIRIPFWVLHFLSYKF